ncbi:ferric reductase-like transmembrane domain-containing protein [Kitasatospora sp. NPDC049258]|uniref:ferric reductase-like transmembrane domain-containing protein n=1 Tax=Kitasatospora sp. NPDC049258 TaxID=3155394 RepID=UPI003427B19D
MWSFLPLLAVGLGLSAVVVNGALQAFLGVAAGVLALVSFSAAVLWGLAATDRLILRPVHRLAAQVVHRAMGIAGVVFLVLHVWVNLIQDRIGAVSAFVPFADPRRPVILGLGALSGYLFLAVALAGAARGLLARTGEVGRWRIVHICAYPAWGAGLVHGLNAGRLPAPWVSVLYSLAVLGVVVALGLRLVFQDRGSLRRTAVPVRPEPESRRADLRQLVGSGSGRRRQDG